MPGFYIPYQQSLTESTDTVACPKEKACHEHSAQYNIRLDVLAQIQKIWYVSTCILQINKQTHTLWLGRQDQATTDLRQPYRITEGTVASESRTPLPQILRSHSMVAMYRRAHIHAL